MCKSKFFENTFRVLGFYPELFLLTIDSDVLPFRESVVS